MPTAAEVIQGTLAMCNRIRAAYDVELLEELPKGEPNSTTSCPIAKAVVGVDGIVGVGSSTLIVRYESDAQALDELLGGNGWEEDADDERYRINLPPEPNEFVTRFDRGDEAEFAAYDINKVEVAG